MKLLVWENIYGNYYEIYFSQHSNPGCSSQNSGSGSFGLILACNVLEEDGCWGRYKLWKGEEYAATEVFKD